MKKFIQWVVTPVIFKQWSNGKFSKIEILYLAIVASLIPAVYRSGTTVPFGFPDTGVEYLWTFLSLVPFVSLFGVIVYLKFKPLYFQLSDIPDKWWITKLCLSTQWWFTMSLADVFEKHELSKRFENEFGQEFGDIKFHWTHRIQFVILLVVCVSVFLLGTNAG